MLEEKAPVVVVEEGVEEGAFVNLQRAAIGFLGPLGFAQRFAAEREVVEGERIHGAQRGDLLEAGGGLGGKPQAEEPDSQPILRLGVRGVESGSLLQRLESFVVSRPLMLRSRPLTTSASGQSGFRESARAVRSSARAG